MYTEAQLVSFGNYLLTRYDVQVFSSDGKNQPIYPRSVSDADFCNWEHENSSKESHTFLPSRYKHKDKVLFIFGGIAIEAFIHAVHFTVSKVKYDLDLTSEDGDSTRIYNVDSAYVADFVPKKIIEP